MPDERLLVFQVSEGWPPLARFLGSPVPRTPFPGSTTPARCAAWPACLRGEAARLRRSSAPSRTVTNVLTVSAQHARRA